MDCFCGRVVLFGQALIVSVQVTHACQKDPEEKCWYNVWYFWMALVCLLILSIMLIVYCIKRYKLERNRVQDIRQAHKPMTVAPGPPSYEEPSHEPPAYRSRPSTSSCDHSNTNKVQVSTVTQMTANQTPMQVCDPCTTVTHGWGAPT